MSVPVIDLSGSKPVEETVREVCNACCTAGFFVIRNHGVPQQLVERHFAQQRAFFDLPEAEKGKIYVNKCNRGWTPMAEETLDPKRQSQGDTKEGLYFGREVAPGSEEASLPLHGPNQWPDPALLPAYRATVTEYFTALTALGHRLLRLLALALDLPAEWFDDKFNKPIILMRPLHYSGVVSQPQQGIFGAGAHTDYGMLTILATDGSPGLQIFANGNWQDVPCIADTFIVNLGDMLERWTNGRFKSTLHRVVSTSGHDRYSTAFFFEPNFSTVVECLPQCCSPDNPAQYPPTSSGQHLLDKYAATHSAFKQLDSGPDV